MTAVVGAAWLSGGSIFAPLAMGLAIFVIIGTLIEVVMRAWRPGLAPGVALKRTFGLPLSFFGGALAHLGVGVTLLGLSGLGFGAETIATLHKGVPDACRPLFDHPRFGRRAGRPELQGDGRVGDRALGRRRRR